MTLALLLAGCAEYSIPDEACRDHVGGAANASDAAVELVGRVDCYRKFVGLDRGRLNGRITEAVEAHANYLEINEVLSDPDGGDWWLETFGDFGYTGRTAYDRLIKSQYLVDDFGAGVFVWEVLSLVEEGLSYSELADGWIDNPFLRDVFLAPAWEGAGYAEFSAVIYGDEDLTVSYMNVVLLHPSGSHASKPTIYPADGQIDVPLSWENPYVVEPQLAGTPAFGGYPITLTFGSTYEVGNEINPLAVEVHSSTIRSGTEEVPHVVVLPDAYSFGEVWSTAMLLPMSPLQPSTTYTVTADVSWVERDHHAVMVTFTTGAGG